jgi:hypothetical protein
MHRHRQGQQTATNYVNKHQLTMIAITTISIITDKTRDTNLQQTTTKDFPFVVVAINSTTQHQ